MKNMSKVQGSDILVLVLFVCLIISIFVGLLFIKYPCEICKAENKDTKKIRICENCLNRIEKASTVEKWMQH